MVEARRLLAAFFLLGVAARVMTLRGPARGADDKPPLRHWSEPAAALSESGPADPKPIELVYVPENMVGLVAFRPAATFRRAGMAHFATRIHEAAVLALTELLGSMKPNRGVKTRDGQSLGLEDIEWVTCGVGFGRTIRRTADGQILHSMMFSGLTVRATRPFDWMAFLRAWGMEFTEVREPGVVYHRITGPLKEVLGPEPGGVYLPDDRTIVIAEEERSRSWFARGNREFRPTFPARSGTGPVGACWPSPSTTGMARSRRRTTSVGGAG